MYITVTKLTLVNLQSCMTKVKSSSNPSYVVASIVHCDGLQVAACGYYVLIVCCVGCCALKGFSTSHRRTLSYL